MGWFERKISSHLSGVSNSLKGRHALAQNSVLLKFIELDAELL